VYNLYRINQYYNEGLYSPEITGSKNTYSIRICLLERRKAYNPALCSYNRNVQLRRTQWRSQALKVRVGTGGLEDRSPPAGSRADPRSHAKTPEAPYIYKEFAAVKCFSTQVCCRVRLTSPPTLLPQKNFGSAWIPWFNTAGAGGHVPTLPQPWLRYWTDIPVCRVGQKEATLHFRECLETYQR